MVVPFVAVVQHRPDPADLVPHAVLSIEHGIADLVNAANGAESETDACDLQLVIRDLIIQLEAASLVAWHRETTFFPQGA